MAVAPHFRDAEALASLQAAFVVPFLVIHEMYLDGHLMPPGVANKTFKVLDDGHVTAPEGPGLGVTIDESQFEKVNADPKRQFKWPKLTLPDGSVRDY